MIAAVLCYLTCDDKVLMLHRVKKEGDIHRDKWNGLGGKLEAGEAPDEALVREVQEESGFVLEDQQYRMRGVLTFPLFDGNQDWLVFLYEGYIEGVPAEGSFGSLEKECPSPPLQDCREGNLVWKPWKEIGSLNLWEGDHIFLKVMRETDCFFSGKFVYKDGQLVEHDLKLY